MVPRETFDVFGVGGIDLDEDFLSVHGAVVIDAKGIVEELPDIERCG